MGLNVYSWLFLTQNEKFNTVFYSLEFLTEGKLQAEIFKPSVSSIPIRIYIPQKVTRFLCNNYSPNTPKHYAFYWGIFSFFSLMESKLKSSIIFHTNPRAHIKWLVSRLTITVLTHPNVTPCTPETSSCPFSWPPMGAVTPKWTSSKTGAVGAQGRCVVGATGNSPRPQTRPTGDLGQSLVWAPLSCPAETWS